MMYYQAGEDIEQLDPVFIKDGLLFRANKNWWEGLSLIEMVPQGTLLTSHGTQHARPARTTDSSPMAIAAADFPAGHVLKRHDLGGLKSFADREQDHQRLKHLRVELRAEFAGSSKMITEQEMADRVIRKINYWLSH